MPEKSQKKALAASNETSYSTSSSTLESRSLFTIVFLVETEEGLSRSYFRLYLHLTRHNNHGSSNQKQNRSVKGSQKNQSVYYRSGPLLFQSLE